MVLGIDPGERRVGIAIADLETRFARPLEVVDRKEQDAAERIAALAGEHSVSSVVVGKPTTLSGRAGIAVRVQSEFVASLRSRLEVPVVEFDERLTTVIAERALREGGASSTTRKQIRDAVAAQIMLQGYLDSTATSS